MLLQEYEAERDQLVSERSTLMNLLKNVQSDISMIDDLMQATKTEKQAMIQQVNSLCEKQYFPLKEAVDSMRTSKGLSRLASLQELEEKTTALYLQKRLHDWNEPEVSSAAKRSRNKRKSLTE